MPAVTKPRTMQTTPSSVWMSQVVVRIDPNPDPSPNPSPSPSPSPNHKQALAHWFGGLSRPAALQRSFRGHSLLPLGAPTELDLELLSRSQLGEISQPRSQPRSQPAALHSAFGAALGDAAATVVAGLAPLPQVPTDSP